MTLKKSERKERYGEILGAMLNNRLDDAFSLLTKMYSDDVSCFFLGHPPVLGWQPIETAPADERILLVMPLKKGVAQIVACITEHGIICPEDNVLACDVSDFSHWMPLPAPPQEAAQ